MLFLCVWVLVWELLLYLKLNGDFFYIINLFKLFNKIHKKILLKFDNFPFKIHFFQIFLYLCFDLLIYYKIRKLIKLNNQQVLQQLISYFVFNENKNLIPYNKIILFVNSQYTNLLNLYQKTSLLYFYYLIYIFINVIL